jgi:hypothetical protein
MRIVVAGRGRDVSSVTNLHDMFHNATAFNQDLSGWCVASIASHPGDFDAGARSWVLARQSGARVPADDVVGGSSPPTGGWREGRARRLRRQPDGLGRFVATHRARNSSTRSSL